MPSVQEILDTGIPDPTFSLRPGLDTPLSADFSRADPTPTPAARVLDPRTDRFEAKSENTPRIQGSKQALLMERQSEQRVNYTTRVDQWRFQDSTTIVDDTLESVLAGENAVEVSGSDNGARLAADAGTTSSGDQAIRAIIERGSADKFGVGWRNVGQSPTIWEYDWTSGDLTETQDNSGTTQWFFARTLDIDVPNRGELIEIRARVTPASGGRGMQSYFYPDQDGSGDSTIFHYLGIEDGVGATSPILTTGSPVTRYQDKLSIPLNGHNPNKGTFFLEFVPLQYSVPGAHFELLEGQFSALNPIILYLDPENTDGGDFMAQTFTGGNYLPGPRNVTPFERSRMALTYNTRTDRRVLSSNGESVSDSNPNGYAGLTDIVFGAAGTENFLILSASYSPDDVSESALNTITSLT